MPIGRLFMLSALLAMGSGVYGLAQNGPQTADPKACSADERLRIAPDGTPQPRDPKPESPSEKLGRTEGVLCPPNVDPEIKAPTPPVGDTPVIPPPGSRGGDQTVRPKQ
jgi:hypothetical protein